VTRYFGNESSAFSGLDGNSNQFAPPKLNMHEEATLYEALALKVARVFLIGDLQRQEMSFATGGPE
jgi:hypothetical protein